MGPNGEGTNRGFRQSTGRARPNKSPVAEADHRYNSSANQPGQKWRSKAPGRAFNPRRVGIEHDSKSVSGWRGVRCISPGRRLHATGGNYAMISAGMEERDCCTMPALSEAHTARRQIVSSRHREPDSVLVRRFPRGGMVRVIIEDWVEFGELA